MDGIAIRPAPAKSRLEASAVDEYLEMSAQEQLDPSRFVVSSSILPTDPAKFHYLENERLG
jgi:hypothetical protein